MCLVKVIANLPMAKIVVVWKLIAEYHEELVTRRKGFSRTLLT